MIYYRGQYCTLLRQTASPMCLFSRFSFRAIFAAVMTMMMMVSPTVKIGGEI